MEGLGNLTKLRRLNLSFNKITKLEGINNLQMLEFIELGKNFIPTMDGLIGLRLPFLTELYLYSN
jgi:Leucine-rich repeat (LRR) protein